MDSAEAIGKVPDFLVLPTMAEIDQAEDGAPILDGIEVTLLPLDDGAGRERLVALAFTTVPRLVEAMGHDQSWVVVPVKDMEKVLEGSGVQGILVDPRLAEGAVGDASDG